METRLTHFDQARRSLELAKNVDEVKEIRDKAEAMRQYARQAHLGLEMQNDCAEIKLRAERRAGELLAETPKNPGGQREHISYQLDDLTSSPQKLAELGISKFQSHNWQRIADIPEPSFEQFVAETKTAKEELTSIGALRLAKMLRREAALGERAALATAMVRDDNILTGDMRELGNAVPDNSIDLIFSDPPYGKEHIADYENLADFGARVLRPGGSLLCYSGQSVLPEVLGVMTRHLTYHWTISIEHTGGAQRFPGKWIFIGWKPILWFVKGNRRDQEYVSDIVRSQKDKEYHDWGQGETEALYYIEHLTQPGELVCDPFCGGGTTCAAAKRLERKYLAFEIDAEVANVARERLSKV